MQILLLFAVSSLMISFLVVFAKAVITIMVTYAYNLFDCDVDMNEPQLYGFLSRGVLLVFQVIGLVISDKTGKKSNRLTMKGSKPDENIKDCHLFWLWLHNNHPQHPSNNLQHRSNCLEHAANHWKLSSSHSDHLSNCSKHFNIHLEPLRNSAK